MDEIHAIITVIGILLPESEVATTPTSGIISI